MTHGRQTTFSARPCPNARDRPRLPNRQLRWVEFDDPLRHVRDTAATVADVMQARGSAVLVGEVSGGYAAAGAARCCGRLICRTAATAVDPGPCGSCGCWSRRDRLPPLSRLPARSYPQEVVQHVLDARSALVDDVPERRPAFEGRGAIGPAQPSLRVTPVKFSG